MKTSVARLLLVTILAGLTAPAFATDPVDLRDKKGVVDPKDLKKDDPKPKSDKAKEPAPPAKAPDNTNYEVKKSGDTTEPQSLPGK